MHFWLSTFLLLSSVQAFEQKYFQVEIPATGFKEITVSQAIQALQRKSLDIKGSELGFNYVFTKKASSQLNQKISLNLTRLPLFEAIKYTALVAGLQVKYERGTVIFLAAKEKYKDPIIQDKLIKLKPQLLSTLRLKSGHYNFNDISLSQAIKKIQQQSREIDPLKKGVNVLIIKADSSAKINLDSQGLSFYSLLKYISLSSGVQMKLDSSAIILTNKM
jgi:hypothetical protein